MYLLLLLITDFCYLSFVDLINNDSIFTTVNILNPFNIVHGIVLGILIMIGNMKDNKKLKIKHSKYYNIITLLLTVIIVVVMQILIYLMILFSNVYNTCI